MKNIRQPARILLIFTLFSACKGEKSGIFSPEKKAEPAVAATTRFERLDPKRTGVQFIPTITEDYRYNFVMDPYIYNGGGVAILDFDNDGLQDLFFTARLQGCRLYRNLGGLKFEDVSEKSGVAKEGGLKTGVCVVDANADGWQDLYVCRTWLTPLEERRNLLFINNKNGTFANQAKAFGLDDLSASQQANFFDYDLDGDLDCYVMNHPTDFKTISQLDFVPTEKHRSARSQPPRNEFESDRFFKNEGNGRFTDLTEKTGILNRAFGLSVTTTDFNDDGYPDIFLGNDFLMPDFAYVNNRNGTFSDRAEAMFRHTSNQTMGVDVGDLNNDGLQEIVGMDMLATPWTRRKRLMVNTFYERDKRMAELGYGIQVMRNVLQLNAGTPPGNDGLPVFSEIGCLAGMFSTDWSWSPLLADFDNDGWRDLFISNGIKRDLNDMDFFLYTADSINRAGGVSQRNFPNFEKYAGLMPSHPVPNFCFQNTGSLQLTDVSKAWGFEKPTLSNGAAYADLDNDGDLDLVTNDLENPPGIYENKAVGMNPNHWLQVKLKGTAQNPQGIGAKIRAFADGGRLIFFGEMAVVRGIFSSSEPIWQVGLGKNTALERLEIEWPGGKSQVLENVTGDRRLVLDIADAKPGRLAPLAENFSKNLIFNEITAASGVNFRHRESKFEDFDRERLLPYRLSTPGPCLASGDLNGDGLDDFFVGGAAGQAGAVFFQNKNGGFTASKQPALESHAAREDAAALFFDADRDGDLDLFVGSGSNEANPTQQPDFYQDRLYRNDERGNFTHDPAALPAEPESAACARAHDFDGDGDLDLFVGSRCVPGRFPLAPRSLVLVNEGGRFREAAAEVAPEFQKIGMVTDLQFADLDKNGVAELLVAGDWMPLSVFQLDGKIFKNATAAFGLENTSGLWNCLTVSDLDGDGDPDIVAGNQGTNYRLEASEGAPLRLFAKDFDGNGSVDPILAVPDGEVYRPLSMRDPLAAQLPSIVKKKFTRHYPYSVAAITDIFSEKDLLSGTALDAKTLKTNWFENRNGKFVPRDLPLETQFAPVQRILAGEFTGDGKTDLLLVGNDYSPEVETQQLDASNGCLLAGDGRGSFAFVPNRRSGFWARLEARDLVELRGAEGRRVFVLGNNNDAIQVFQLK